MTKLILPPDEWLFFVVRAQVYLRPGTPIEGFGAKRKQVEDIFSKVLFII